MKKILRVAGLLLASAGTFLMPLAASARDRDDYYSRHLTRHERHELREHRRHSRALRHDYYVPYRYGYRYSPHYGYGFYDRYGYWHRY